MRDLRGLMAPWCDLQTIHDLRSIEAVCTENPRQRSTPLALIVEPRVSIPAALMDAIGSANEVIDFLGAVREHYPKMRRVVIADEDDLSLTIKGLHTGLIDSLLHKPFDTAGVLTALRAQKQQPGQAGESAARFA
jgi:DNA-binding NtrC family response regulator